ncbi:hypothetical protein QWY85_08415 [Neolewinella lacunae]|uniref:Effector-associated domain-containing protein n=1 Tax=Neolewinella lacunae TaxID=1517758 RepID=A0A923PH74_9BACT|nr:hypothetical protein [Neolewinella lacunae]MBC6994007.1 hypothetical protein [Neolewinella lacunae]MDN3634677.1 hypothetical protein [Neolewinella lacunae]
MSITTQEQLEELKETLRTAVAEAATDEALELLRTALPPERPKHQQVILLASRYADLLQYQIGNTLDPLRIDVLRQELRQDILAFVTHLALVDFSPQAPGRPELKPGHLLYKVPPRMQVRQAHECLVRVAHQLSQVLSGIALDDSVSLEEIPVAQVMEVEIIDPCLDGVRQFDILLLSDGEQIVDEYSYTEWVFHVRPLVEGRHELVLKISVLLTVAGKERTKNLILRRPIEVRADAEPGPATPLQRVNTADPGAVGAAAEELPNPETEIEATLPPPRPAPPQAGGKGLSTQPFPSPLPHYSPSTVPPDDVTFSSRPKKSSGWLRPMLTAAATVLFLLVGFWAIDGRKSSENLTGTDDPTNGVRTDSLQDATDRQDSLRLQQEQ